MCAKNQLSTLIFIFISCLYLSSVVNSCWQVMTAAVNKFKLNFHFYPKGYMCAKFQLSRLIFNHTLKVIGVPNFSSLGWISFWSSVKSCYQLLNFVWELDSHFCPKVSKHLNGIFINTLKETFVPNFSSLGWFSLSSAVSSCLQLMTAVTQKINGTFISP